MYDSVTKFLAACAAIITTTFGGWGGHDGGGCDKLDLLVNGKDDPRHVVYVDDMKPGDDWFIDKDLLVKCKDAKVFVHLTDLHDYQGHQTEPEEEEENGTPKSDMQNYMTYDLKVQDEVVIDFADHIAFPDAFSCWIPLGEIKKDTHLTITQSFHFDSDVTNWAQGDKLVFTEEFLATASDDYPRTDSGRIWDPTLKHCVPGPTPTPKPTKTPTPPPTPPPTPTACLNIQFSGPPIIGTNGDNNLNGTPGNDLIFALGGDDKVEGNSGDDCIVGGSGKDRLNGNNGNDYIEGNSGNDDLFGNNEDDTLIGGSGFDSAEGNNGTDTCSAEVESHCEL